MNPGINRIVITGTSGAIGSYLLRRFVGAGAQIAAIFSRPESLTKLRLALPDLDWTSVTPLFADLCHDDQVAGLHDPIIDFAPDLFVHAAADVSWTKSSAQLGELNIGGAMRLADLAALACPGARFIMFSTAYAHRPDGIVLNDYELTKRTAEQSVCGAYAGRLRIGIIRPSLVIGDSATGWIGRFNGLYPLVRVMAFGEVPCLIGQRDYRVDLVPVDWIADDLEWLAGQIDQASEPVVTTTAAGSQSLRLDELLAVVANRIDIFCTRHGRPPPKEVSIITRRQFDFLMRASTSWDMEERFEHAKRVSEVMAGYLNHAEGAIDLVATRPRAYPGGGVEVIGRAVDHWLDCHAERMASPRNVHWAAGLDDAPA